MKRDFESFENIMKRCFGDFFDESFIDEIFDINHKLIDKEYDVEIGFLLRTSIFIKARFIAENLIRK